MDRAQAFLHAPQLHHECWIARGREFEYISTPFTVMLPFRTKISQTIN